jgi:hypothetical protein
MTFHRWVVHDRVPEYLMLGWMALPTLEGTGHGIYSAHCVWLCDCTPIEPGFMGMTAEEWRRERAMAHWIDRTSALSSPQ